jgi:putative zinc finger/helix-turn-helix YgiT family protein
MKCPICNKGVLKTRREDYLYTECGLQNIVLEDIEVDYCSNPKCGEVMPTIPRILALHSQLALHIARQKAKLSGSEIRFLRKYLGWSSRDAAQHLGVTVETMSRWENGQTPMGASAERLLRVLSIREKPVEEYPLEVLTEVGQKNAPRPRLGMRATSKGWKLAA